MGSVFQMNHTCVTFGNREHACSGNTIVVPSMNVFTDEIAREVFGALTDEDITSVRMSKKNFCHIRFGSEASVDKAMQLSGFRMRISGLNDPPNTGKLHVDFAKARDDEVG